MAVSAVTRRSRAPVGQSSEADLDAVAARILWLAVRMVHEANHVRPNGDGIKVGGHQASSASVVSILTALYFRWLKAGDLVSVKPHASPAYHAVQYLLGRLDCTYLTRLRSFGGLQSYPSRTKDPDRVDFSTGSVGLGAVAPMFAALADRYLRLHFKEAAAQPHRRFVALVGDAELDEGNIWEALLEDATAGLGNVTIIVDVNRQSLDRVVPGIRIARIQSMFSAAGWHVLEAKYGDRLQRQPDGAGGNALRERLDAMRNEEYQVLIRLTGAEARDRLLGNAHHRQRDDIARAVGDVRDEDLPGVLADLAGHDQRRLAQALTAADLEVERPTVLFAYTIKGWRLPFAGDSLNHSAQLSDDQVTALARTLRADPDDPWAAFAPDSREGRLCATRSSELSIERHAQTTPAPAVIRLAIDSSFPAKTSTQQAFGDSLSALAREPVVGPRVVTVAPDVAVSTNLGGWINRAGIFSSEPAPQFDDAQRPLVWKPAPAGRHIELGISEMNLFLLLGQFGSTSALFGEPLAPIGTVYDPFIARGLDALIYALYVRSRFILVGTPSGTTLAPEGGAHQSTVTPSLGIELPGLRAYEPAFAQEVAWTLLEGIRGCLHDQDGFATYLRLSTRPVDQTLASTVETRRGRDGWHRDVLAGGYRLIDVSDSPEPLPADAPVVNVFAAGAVVPEAVAAVRMLHREEVAANLVVITSAERLAADIHDRRLSAIRNRSPDDPGHVARLIPLQDRRAPIVTVADAASHALSFLGGVFGAPVVALGVDQFGQSGTIPDLYATAGIDADHILEAALLGIELAAGA